MSATQLVGWLRTNFWAANRLVATCVLEHVDKARVAQVNDGDRFHSRQRKRTDCSGKQRALVAQARQAEESSVATTIKEEEIMKIASATRSLA